MARERQTYVPPTFEFDGRLVERELPWCQEQCSECGALHEGHDHQHGATKRFKVTESMHRIDGLTYCGECFAALYGTARMSGVTPPVCDEEHDCEWGGTACQ